MKLTKRFLSVFIALALVVGAVAVAANAEAPLAQFSGSVLTYSITSDKTTDGVTSVAIGDTITISVYMQTNYYVGSTGCELFLWTSGVFEPLGSNYTIENVAAKYGRAINSPMNTAGYPAGYAAGDYVAFQINRPHDATHTQTEACTTPQRIYTFTFSVPDDESLIGETARFFMPPEAVGSATVTGKKSQIRQSVNNNDTNVGGIYLASLYAETVNVGSLSINIVAADPEFCDYTALQTTYDACDELAYTAEYYDSTEYATYTAALGAAEALLAVKDSNPLPYSAENQATIDNAKTALQAAYDALDARFVDLTDLEDTIDSCTAPAYAEEFYAADKYQAWEDAFDAANTGLTDYAEAADTATNRDAVNGLGDDLQSAYDALVPNFVDLTDLEDTIDNCTTPAYAEEFYDAAKYGEWKAAMTLAQAGLTTYAEAADTATNRDAVKELADDLTNKYKALTPNFVDLSDLEDTIDSCTTPAYAEEFYDADDYAAWDAALKAANKGLTDYAEAADTATNRDAVNGLGDDLQGAYDALVPNFVDLTDLEDTIDSCKTPAYAEEFYAADKYQAWEDAFEAANTGLTDYAEAADTATNRDAVNGLGDDLQGAYDALVPNFVDLTALNKAISDCAAPELGAEYYDTTEYAAWQTALSAAQTGATTYDSAADTETNRAAVKKLTDDLTAAFDALDARFVDYSALETALTNYGTTPLSQSNYVATTYDAWKTARDAAQALLDSKPTPAAPATDTATQAAINNAAAALQTAYEGLETVDCHIISITPQTTDYQVGDTVVFAVLCDSTSFVKIQIRNSDGGTMTYTRDHSSVQIVDNNDGTETWNIALKIYADTFTYSARAKFENTATGWDTVYRDYNGQTTIPEEDAEVKSAAVFVGGNEVTTFTTNDMATITVVTGADTLRIRLLDTTTNGTITLSRPTSVNPDGTKVWSITRKFAARDYTYKLFTADSSNVMAETDESVSFTVTKYVPAPVTPSTGDMSDAVISVNYKARIIRCTYQEFTVVTDKNCSGFRLVDAATGTVVAGQRTGGVASGDTITWTLSKFYHLAVNYNYKVEALYGTQWIDSGKTVSFTVAY